MNQHTGSDFDAFLDEENIIGEVSAKAHKRLIALQLADIMQTNNITKTSLAKRLNTSRSQVDRILDVGNTAITLEILEKVARAVGKTLRIEFA